MTPSTPGWDRGIVLLAANSWDGVKLQDRHLAERLAPRVPVLYVDPPLSRLSPRRNPDAAAALVGPRLRQVADGIVRLTPVVLPRPERRGTATINRALTVRLVRRAVARLGMRPRAIVATRPLGPRLTSFDFGLRIFWAQDDLAGGAALLGLSESALRSGEASLAAAADLVVTSTPGVDAHWRARGADPVLVPYGCDAQAYADVDRQPWPDDVDLPRPIAGFVGFLGDRIDYRLLEAVADRGCSLLLVGARHPRSDDGPLDRLLRRSNVAWVGPQPFEALPRYLRAIDVGVVPYADTPFNRGSFPLKTLEYLAAGRPVVATGLPATRWLDTALVQMADEPTSFADHVVQALSCPSSEGLVAQRRAFAARHSWTVRADAFLAAMQSVGEGARSAATPARTVERSPR